MKPGVILGGLLATLVAAAPAPAPAQEDEIYDDTAGGDAQPVPPPPPATIPEPELQQPPQQELPQPAVPSGQWVNTWQYGWVWMPYGAPYTATYADAPVMYVYGPVFGWAWVSAPWVWGWGPWPFFGVAGFAHFCWYGHGPWTHPGWQGRPWPTTGPRPHPPPVGASAATSHGGVRPAPPPVRSGSPQGTGIPPRGMGGARSMVAPRGMSAPLAMAAPRGGLAAPHVMGGAVRSGRGGGGGAHFGGHR